MPKRKSSEAKSTIIPSKKSKTPSRAPIDPEVARLNDLLADANALNESWRIRVLKLVEEKTKIETRNKELEKLVKELSPCTKTKSPKKSEEKEKEMAYIVHSTWHKAYEEPMKDFEGLYYDLETANKAALIAYKNIHPDVDWRDYPITDRGTLDHPDVRDDEAIRATSHTGAHKYKIQLIEEYAEVTVEPCEFLSAATINRRKDKASDLPWKQAK